MPFVLFIVSVPAKVKSKADDAVQSVDSNSTAKTIKPIAPKVRDFIVSRAECEWISEEPFLNGKAWWTSYMFTCLDASSEEIVDALCDLGVGASIAASAGDEAKGKGMILVLPITIQRVGSRPKVCGRPATLPYGKPISPPGSPPSSLPGSPAPSTSSVKGPAVSPQQGIVDVSKSLLTDDSDESSAEDDEFTEEVIRASYSVSIQEGDDGHGRWKKMTASFNETIKSRISVDSVIQYVMAGSEFSFDYVMLITSASIIACVGLVTNNTVVIVASMLVSPLMGPILAVTFGAVVDHRQLMKRGLFSETVGLFMCIVIGFIGGLCSAPFCGHSWPTQEMASRGVPSALWTGVAIAIPSGFGAALSVLGNNTSSLVGVAISASLLPPAVNCGVLLAAQALQNTKYIDGDNEVEVNGEVVKFGDTAALISFGVTLVNILLIYVCAYAMFYLKGLGLSSTFWSTDVANVKKYHRALRDPEKKSSYEHAFEAAKHEKASMHSHPMDKIKASGWKVTPFIHSSSVRGSTSREHQN